MQDEESRRHHSVHEEKALIPRMGDTFSPLTRVEKPNDLEVFAH